MKCKMGFEIKPVIVDYGVFIGTESSEGKCVISKRFHTITEATDALNSMIFKPFDIKSVHGCQSCDIIDGMRHPMVFEQIPSILPNSNPYNHDLFRMARPYKVQILKSCIDHLRY